MNIFFCDKICCVNYVMVNLDFCIFVDLSPPPLITFNVVIAR